MRVLSLAFAFASLSVAGACNKSEAPAPLPPAGLAGAPGASTAPEGAGVVLPGAGAPAAAMNGGAIEPGAQLPAGHPPIDGADAAAPGAAGVGAGALPGAGGAPATTQTLSGKVLEVLNVPTYTYLRVQTGGAEEWVAVNTASVKVGETVTFQSQIVMENFPSKSLNRTFAKLHMGVLVGAPTP